MSEVPWWDSIALRHSTVIRRENGAGEGTRTPDPLITNQMLYQLSYAGLAIAAQYSPKATGNTRVPEMKMEVTRSWTGNGLASAHFCHGRTSLNPQPDTAGSRDL